MKNTTTETTATAIETTATAIAIAIAESAIEATMGYAGYHTDIEEYRTAIDACDADDMRTYAEMIGIDDPSDEDIATAIAIYHTESAIERMMGAF